MNSLANNNTELITINYLLETINKSKIYQNRIKPECLVVVTEGTTTEYYDLAIREKHTGNCHGDPSTSPILDRFRAYSAKKILWHDIVNNGFLSFDEFVKLKKEKK